MDALHCVFDSAHVADVVVKVVRKPATPVSPICRPCLQRFAAALRSLPKGQLTAAELDAAMPGLSLVIRRLTPAKEWWIQEIGADRADWEEATEIFGGGGP